MDEGASDNSKTVEDSNSSPKLSEVENGNKTNEEKDERKKIEPAGNCYCGKERNLNIAELLCANCNRWFHESCIGYQMGKLVPFLTNYVFLCKNCSPSNLESFRKTQAQITQMCVTAIANLQQASVKDGSNKLMFSKEKEIIPYIEHHWEALTTTSRRVTQSWHLTVQKALMKEIHILFVFEENNDEGHMYGLIDSNLTHIRPNYDAMIKGGLLKVTELGVQHGSTAGNVKSRKTKSKAPDVNVSGKKGRNLDVGCVKLPSHGYPLDHPFNKDGYRYLLAEPDPHAPCRQEFDESPDWAGKPIPGWLYRTFVPSTVLLALHDRGPQLKISEDRLSVTGDKGYSAVKATHCVTTGVWYWEATIDEMPEGSATRIGWGQDYANLQAPLGYDKFGYSWRSRKGTKFHISHGKHYADVGYGEGDTVGFMIILPQNSTTQLVPNTFKDKPLVKFKSHLYHEEKDSVQSRVKTLKVLPGGKVINFKNGVSQGVAFEDIYQGAYYPTISLYRNVTVTANFGPNFKYPPPAEFNWRGMHEKAEEAICEHTMADILYLTENEGKLRLDTFVL
ncbi:set1/Ash2 histone methyltransferase complex subunit ASH2 [Harmonia axyridis]|uniref:set1/Ash2 histone methyltransferase complex subunit ASH2 n=1 Tax=Harmonia axyridis TaxID=115357 RepID=UPI001E27726E|nr:set1/Ash2 histone methyltransferase complex subunit ASH2 [Harmonia axyridis]